MGVLEALFELIGKALSWICQVFYDIAVFLCEKLTAGTTWLCETLYEVLIIALSVCCILFALSNPLAWEVIYRVFTAKRDDRSWRQKAGMCCIMSVICALSAFSTPICYISPLRWHQLNFTWKIHNCVLRHDDLDLQKLITAKTDFIQIAFRSLLDCLLLPFVFAASLLPDVGGSCIVHFPLAKYLLFGFRFARMQLPTVSNEAFSVCFDYDQRWKLYQDYNHIVSDSLAFSVVFMIAYIIVAPLSLLPVPLLILTPSAWGSSIRSILHLVSEYKRYYADWALKNEKELEHFQSVYSPSSAPSSDKHGAVRSILNAATMGGAFLDYHSSLRALLWPYVFRMPLDLLCYPFALLAYLSPIRRKYYLTYMDICTEKHQFYLAEFFPELFTVQWNPRAGDQLAVDSDIDGAASKAPGTTEYSSFDPLHPAIAAAATATATSADQEASAFEAATFDYAGSGPFMSQERIDAHLAALVGWRARDGNSWTPTDISSGKLDGSSYRQVKSSVYVDVHYESKLIMFNELYAGTWTGFDRYTWRQRTGTLYYGLLALMDVLLLPLLFPLFVTDYRWQPIAKELTAKQEWGPHEIFLIFRQAFLLFLDVVIILPLVPILFVTRLRYKAVQEGLKTDFAGSVTVSCELYCTIITSTAFILMDLTVMPLVFVLFISQIRFSRVKRVLLHVDLATSFELSMKFYGKVLCSCLLLLCDVAMLPVYAFLFISHIHWPAMQWRIEQDLIQSFQRPEDELVHTMAVYACRTYMVALGWTMLTFVELLVVLPVAIALFFTRIRWKPVWCDLVDMEAPTLSHRGNPAAPSWRNSSEMACRLISNVVRSAGLLILDALFLPGALFLWVTRYRSGIMTFMFWHKYMFHHGMNFHFLILKQVQYVLADVLIFALGCLVALNPAYTGLMFTMFKHALLRQYPVYEPAVFCAYYEKEQRRKDAETARIKAMASDISANNARMMAASAEAEEHEMVSVVGTAASVASCGSESSDSMVVSVTSQPMDPLIASVSASDDASASAASEGKSGSAAVTASGDVYNYRAWASTKFAHAFDEHGVQFMLLYERGNQYYDEGIDGSEVFRLLCISLIDFFFFYPMALCVFVLVFRAKKLSSFISNQRKAMFAKWNSFACNFGYAIEYRADASDMSRKVNLMPAAALLRDYAIDSPEVKHRAEYDSFIDVMVHRRERDVNGERFSKYVEAHQTMLGEVRYKIFAQFIFTIRDLFFLIPFAVVVGTFYRFIPFLIDAIAKSGAKPILDVKPLFVVRKCRIHFPESGSNPELDLELLPTEIAEAEDAAAALDMQRSTATADAAENGLAAAAGALGVTLAATRAVSASQYRARESGLDTVFFSLAGSKLQVFSKPLWDLVAVVFGGAVASIAKAFVPLSLNSPIDINIQDFQDQVQNYRPNPVQSGGGGSSSNNNTLRLVVNIPAKKTKKSSIAKKLRSLKDVLQLCSQFSDGNMRELNSSATSATAAANTLITDAITVDGAVGAVGKNNDVCFVLQIECKRKTKSGLLESAVLCRICPSIYELTEVAESISGDTSYFATSNATGTGPLSDKRFLCAAQSDLNQESNGSGWSTDNDLVDSFYFMVLLAFIEILVDAYHLFLFAFTCLLPWRAVELLEELFSPLQSLPFRYATRIMSGIENAEIHLNDYVREVLPMLNATSKKGSLLRMPFMVGNSASEFNWPGWSSAPVLNFESSGSSPIARNFLTKYLHRMERNTIACYLKLRARTIVYLAGNSEWFSVLANLESERNNLHSVFLDLLALKSNVMRDGVLLYTCAQAKVPPPTLEPPAEALASASTAADADDVAKAKALVDRVERVLPAAVATVNARIEENKILLAENRRKILRAYQEIADHCHVDHHVNGLVPKANMDFDERMVVAAMHLPDLKKSNKRCLYNQPINETRQVIRRAARYVLRDAFVIFALSFMLLSVVMAVPLIRDLWQLRSIDIRRYRVRACVQRHISYFFTDLWCIVRCVLWVVACACTVFGFLPFLDDLPAHLSTFDAVSELAKLHISRSMRYFCQSLAYLLSPRTYYLVFRSTFYAAFVPGAVTGDIGYEAEPGYQTGAAHWWALIIGSAVWLAILVLSIITSSKAVKAGSGTVALADSTKLSFALVGAIFCFMVISHFCVFRRKHFQLPAASSQTAPSFSYQKFLALLTPLFESAQLCAIIVYFFWSTTPYEVALSSNGISASGAWAARLYSWGAYDGGQRGYNKAMDVACGMGFLWVLMVTLPAAVSGEDRDPCIDGGAIYLQRGKSPKQKATAIRSSPIYKFCTTILTRLFTVWLFALFLRPLSCMEIPTVLDGLPGPAVAVLSTSPEVECGGGTSWASRTACSLLVHFIVTTVIIGSDDADELTDHLQDNIEAHSEPTVKFSPLYALQVRICQFFCVAACMGGFSSANVNAPLVPVIVACVIMCLVPLLHSSAVCSFRPLISYRSCGALGCAWTAALCLYRHHHNASSAKPISDYQSAVVLFTGWAILLALGTLGYIFITKMEHAAWLKYLNDNGFNSAVTNLEEVVDTLLVHETTTYSQLASLAEEAENRKSEAKAAAAGATAAGVVIAEGGINSSGTEDSKVLLSSQSLREVQAQKASANATARARAGFALAHKRHQKLRGLIAAADTVPKLALALAEIEDQIVCERLKLAFLVRRTSFHHNVLFYNGLDSLYHSGRKENTVTRSASEILSGIQVQRLVFGTDYLRDQIKPYAPTEVENKFAIVMLMRRLRLPADLNRVIYSYLKIPNGGLAWMDKYIDTRITSQRIVNSDKPKARKLAPVKKLPTASSAGSGGSGSYSPAATVSSNSSATRDAIDFSQLNAGFFGDYSLSTLSPKSNGPTATLFGRKGQQKRVFSRYDQDVTHGYDLMLHNLFGFASVKELFGAIANEQNILGWDIRCPNGPNTTIMPAGFAAAEFATRSSVSGSGFGSSGNRSANNSTGYSSASSTATPFSGIASSNCSGANCSNFPSRPGNLCNACYNLASASSSSSSAGSSDDAGTSLMRVGQKVEAKKWRNDTHWTRAIINHVNGDGTYGVTYANGEKVSKVAASLIRTDEGGGSPAAAAPNTIVEAQPMTFRVGDRVEANRHGHGEWLPGTVCTATGDGFYNVKYEDGVVESRLTKYRLRPWVSSGTGASASGAATSLINTNGSIQTAEQAQVPAFRVGDKVEANWHGYGKWIPGTISAVSGNGFYNVKYEDGGMEAGLLKHRIRLLVSSGTGTGASASGAATSLINTNGSIQSKIELQHLVDNRDVCSANTKIKYTSMMARNESGLPWVSECVVEDAKNPAQPVFRGKGAGNDQFAADRSAAQATLEMIQRHHHLRL